MWTVEKVKEGVKAGSFRVKHSGGYVHAHFRIKSVAKREAEFLNKRNV